MVCLFTVDSEYFRAIEEHSPEACRSLTTVDTEEKGPFAEESPFLDEVLPFLPRVVKQDPDYHRRSVVLLRTSV